MRRFPIVPEVSIVFIHQSERRWAVLWRAPFHIAVQQFTTRAEAVVVARRLAIGTPAFLRDGEAFPARDAAVLHPWSTDSIEDVIDDADAMLNATLARRAN